MKFLEKKNDIDYTIIIINTSYYSLFFFSIGWYGADEQSWRARISE